MPEVETPVRWVKLDYLCECGGKMVSINTMLPSCPPKYVHACTNCRRNKALGKAYPTTEWREDR